MPKGEEIVQECEIGLVRIRRQGDELAFIAPPLMRSGAVDSTLLERVRLGLGLAPGAIVRSQWVDNGAGWLAVMLAERDVGLLNQGYLTALKQAIGKKLTRPLLPDQVLAPIHVQMADAIRKGDQVVISARSAGISVRMQGEALSDGIIGKQISVRNQRSNRVIRARVIGPGQVEVAM